MTCTALIDGDVIRYKCGFAGEKTKYFVRHAYYGCATFDYKADAVACCKDIGVDVADIDSWVDLSPVENVLHSVKQMLNRIIEEVKATDARIFLSGKGNFRDELYDEYKGNRKDRKPVHYDAITQYLLEHWNAEVVEGQEADDAMGIAQCSAPEDTTIICTIDKDLLMIPGKHYNLDTRESRWIGEYDGLLNFYKQLLTGDRTDNIPGLDGVGPKTADKILGEADNEDELFRYTYNKYLEREQTIETLIRNGQLLWIRRKEGELWQPPLNP